MQSHQLRGLVVVVVDASPNSYAAIGRAFATAARLGAELILLHIVEDSTRWDEIADAPWYPSARRLVTEALDGWPAKYPDVVFRTHYRVGSPAGILPRYADIADLVVLPEPARTDPSPTPEPAAAR